MPPMAFGQGVANVVDLEDPHNSITHMLRVTMDENKDTDPDRSVLTRAGIKLQPPEVYSGSTDLEEFEIFVAGVQRWLRMSHLLGLSNNNEQLNLLGTCLQGGAWEWFYRNVEHPEQEVHRWTFESAIQGLQCRFLHRLTHHHASNKYKSAMQGNQTVHELLNNLQKYAGRMIMHPDTYIQETIRIGFMRIVVSRDTQTRSESRTQYNWTIVRSL